MGPGCVVIFLSLIITALQIEESVGKPDAIIACPGILTSYDCPIFDDESDFPLSIWSIESCPELRISHNPSGHPSLESDTCGPFTVQPTGSNGTHYTSTLSFIASIELNGTEITVKNGANGEIVCRAEILVQEPDSFSVSVTTNATTGATTATCSLTEDFIGLAHCRLVVFDSYGHNYTFLSDEQVHAGTSVTLDITQPDGSPLKPDIKYYYNATLDNGVDATLSCKLLSGTITPSSDVSGGGNGNETEGTEPSAGLSDGAVVGIVVAVVVVAVIVVALLVITPTSLYIYKKRKTRTVTKQQIIPEHQMLQDVHSPEAQTSKDTSVLPSKYKDRRLPTTDTSRGDQSPHDSTSVTNTVPHPVSEDISKDISDPALPLVPTPVTGSDDASVPPPSAHNPNTVLTAPPLSNI